MNASDCARVSLLVNKTWSRFSPLALALASLAACIDNGVVEEGGANANERTFGKDGETLLTGAMTMSPNGRYAVMQRNTVTLVFDVTAKRYTQLPTQLDRIAFSKKRDVVYAMGTDRSLSAIDLATTTVLWKQEGHEAATLLGVDANDSAIVAGNALGANVFDAQTGSPRGGVAIGSPASQLTFMNDGKHALVVGQVSWPAHAPSTPVSLLDLATATAETITVPNCEAPIQVLPDDSRALLSPTFCAEGTTSTPEAGWTNPDPVSIIDIANGKLSFSKNLPGFGPVALSADGARAVAYLDTKRMDPAMFADKSQVPSTSGLEYHIMVIDPHSLSFTLTPIGNALPRFAMTRDGKGLLVDASVKVKTRVKADAHAKIEVGPQGISGEVGAEPHVFQEKSPFGYFDLTNGQFTGFAGPQAGLDRFVQLADGQHVVTLERRKDGLGGTPYLIDLQTKSTVAINGNFGTGVRDIGLLPDGKTVLLRVRLAANTKNNQLYSREGATMTASLDFGVDLAATFEDSVPFASATPDSDDCPGGHDCW